ncbi:1973_t:CDS:10 [Racocetra persica]|uniref:1973_t:CDS:1 n=1 Tax=Racocetra persica TaxID=160502 RepID=A0ACA9L470_9GLOM|nr:1973_t:CDS:10 [Racocetra persica]
MVSQSNRDKTFSNQSRIPRLPVPTLEETTTKYLHSLRPLLSAKDLARNEAHIKDFIKPNGLGRVLQQRLIDIDRISPNNWLDDNWWIKKAYQEWRVSVVVNSNWFHLYVDDSNTPREYFSVNNGVKPRGHFLEFQIKRAAHLINKLLEYKSLIDSEQIPPNTTQAYPLCMFQYTRLFGYTRIPQHGCDKLVYSPHPTPLNDIIADVENTQLDPPIGILTTDDRDSWTMSRERLLAISPQNRESLTLIENALFAVNLDDYATGTDLDKFLGNIFHGVDGHNRWFDKSMSIIVDSNGRAGMNGEHSPCDALIPLLMFKWILKVPVTLNAHLSGRPIPPPFRIRFVTNEQTLKDIFVAENKTKALIADSDATHLQFSEYGAQFIKKFVGVLSTPREYFSVNNGVKPRGHFLEFQIKRAAHLINKLLEYKSLIDSEQIPPNTTQAYPLCMFQYTRLFGYTRIPQHGCDKLVYSPHPTPLNDIIADVENTQLDPPIGILTTDDRDSWTMSRERLLAISPQNRESLTLIENALFAVNLDDYATGTDLDKFLGNIFHGVDGHNRWFDKSMSIIVDSNGRAGMNGEHSPCDALIPLLMFKWILKVPVTLNAHLSGRPIPPPFRIRFVTNEQTLKDIFVAENKTKALIADSDATHLQFSEYGAQFIKKFGKCSPDAYFQMVIQLAYYQLHGRVVPTYETGATRQFLRGRTETIRTLSVESKAFVEGMLDKSLSVQQKYDLLQAATKAHTKYSIDASNGKGCDRHLLGLRLLLQTGESHPIFEEPIFAKSQEWLLSTSSLGSADYAYGAGFGCVCPNGYGINYLPDEHSIKVSIESKFSSSETDSKALKESMIKALRDMKNICEQANGEHSKL